MKLSLSILRLSIIAFAIFHCNFSNGQYLNVPGTGIANSPINFPNTSGITDFSNNSFYTNSESFTISTNPLVNLSTYTFPSNLLQTPAFSDLAYDGTNYYLFTNNYNGGVIRWDFGNNLMSIPTAVSLGNLGNQQNEGIVIRKENNNWYGFIASNGSTTKLTRINFGVNLSNTSPTTTSLGTLNLSWPHELAIIDEGGNWYGFVANRNSTVTRLDFGTSLTNTPTTFNYTNPAIVQPCNLRVLKDAGSWYLFSMNLFNGDIVRSDLGTNIANNTPTYTNLGEPHPTLGIARGFTILQDCNGLRGLLSDESSNIFNLSFAGDSITGALSGTPLNTISWSNGEINDFTPFWMNDTLFFFVTNPYSWVGRCQINPTQTPTSQGSTAFSPTFTYTTAGNYDISHLINTGDNGMRSQCEQINIGGIVSVNRMRCPGDTIMLSNNTVISIPGTYIDTLKDINNQDSLINVAFSHYATYSDIDTASICQGQTYTLPSNLVVSAAGVYIDTLNTINGCDSIITTVLNVNPSYLIAVNDTICSNVTYQLPGGSTTSTSGTYSYTFSTTALCDSTIVTNLHVYPAFQITILDTICAGANYTLPDATVVNTTGMYVTPFQTTNNCDSIITTQLTVTPNYTIQETINLCDQTSYQLPNGNSVTTSGVYTSTIASTSGCDSIIISTVNFNSTSTNTQNVRICSNNTFTLPNNSIVSTAGQYITTVTGTSGCDSIVTTNLDVVEAPLVDLGGDITICNNERITLDVSTPNAIYLWNDGNSSGIRTISESGTYEVQITVEPCAPVRDEIIIYGCDCKLFMPNAFSPNGDGNNDIFRPIMNCNIVPGSFIFKIFNRWGENVYQTNIPGEGWNGTLWGELQPIGTYFYYLKFINQESKKEVKYQGDANLIK